MYFNRTIIYGYLTQKPLLEMSGDTKSCKFTLSNTRVSTDSSGGRISEYQTFDFIAYGTRADAICNLLKAGDPLLIEGRLECNKEGAIIIVEKYQFGPRAKMVGQEII